MVVNELRGEKVDIVPYSDNPSDFVQKALAPARVREVRIHEDTGTAEVIVPDFQLSLAIGKEGQNARLAARLSGWRVDIKSETQLQEEEAGEVEYAEGEWVKSESGELVFQPAGGGEAISAAEAGYASPVSAEGEGEAEAEGEATLEAQVAVAPVPEADPEMSSDVAEGSSDEAPAPVDAEEAAMHVSGPEDDVASDADNAPVDIEAPVAAGEQVDVAASEQVAPSEQVASSEREETDA
jgi:N utilization substance protein A